MTSDTLLLRSEVVQSNGRKWEGNTDYRKCYDVVWYWVCGTDVRDRSRVVLTLV